MAGNYITDSGTWGARISHVPSKPESGVWGSRLRDKARSVLGHVLAVTLMVALAGASANAAKAPLSPNAKYSPELQALLNAGDKKVDIVVQFTSAPGTTHFQHMGAAGAVLKRELKVIKGGHFTVPAKLLPAIAALPEVAYITLDRPVQLTGTVSTTTTVYPTQAVMADVAWANGYNGSGIGVAVIDSGVTDRPDLHTPSSGNYRVVYSESFVPGDSSTSDAYGHGTHVAGIVASNGASANYASLYSGIAPGVNIINLRVLDGNGSGTDSAVIAAIQRAIQLQAQYNIRVINLSLGRGVFESYTLDPLCQAVESAWKAGIFVSVAAGNNGRDNSLGTNGYGTINSPGIDPYAMTVGATLTNPTALRVLDIIASYSSKGPTLIDHIVKPDIVAPGNQIVSLRSPGSTLANAFPNDDIQPAYVPLDPTTGAAYFRLSGTSMATPVVSGAAALLLQQNPSLTPDQLKARLMKTAWKGFVRTSKSQARSGQNFSNEYDVFTYGAGYVDIWAALNNNDLATGPALSPTAYYNPVTGTVTINNVVLLGNTVCWGSSVMWGAAIVWGANQFTNASSVLWGAALWDDNSQQGFSVLWGSSVLWGASTSQALSSDEDGEDLIDPTSGAVIDPSTLDPADATSTTSTTSPTL
ncbi:MAG TPA: S8 family peptidase [Terriglobales bacterium]|nr:S8 family peptidase [Terriglobales bacterium]